MTINGSQPKKPRKHRAGMSIKHIDLEKIHKRLLNVLSRETAHLLELSYKGKLEKDDSASLTNYLKLLKDLKKPKEEAAEVNLTDEQLEKIANGETT